MEFTNNSEKVDTSNLFRMPWTMSDNGFSWLEPTRSCNLRCEYCYQKNVPDSDKSLETIEQELELLNRLRKCDVMLIAGGEPLVHPKIIEIVRMVAESGVRPVLLTNGVALTPSLVDELKDAGVKGFIFHVDSGQARPGWRGASEKALNKLRQRLADMVYDAGGLVCAFNTTVLPRTLEEVPEIVKWTVDNPDKVYANVLIPVRGAHRDEPFDYYAGPTRIDVDKTPYATAVHYDRLEAHDICCKVRDVLPDYGFHSFLGGTVVADAPKWLFGTHIASSEEVLGNLGPKGAEAVQQAWHFAAGKYLALPTPSLQSKAGLLFFLSLFDRTLRKAFFKRVIGLLKKPWKMFRRLYVQNIVVMQPHDILANGEQDECDGCPNKTVWEGRLVSECRKEDYINFARPIVTVPKCAKIVKLENRIAS